MKSKNIFSFLIVVLMCMSMMCCFAMNANAMDNIPLKTTSPIPDDPDTPFIEQYVHDRLQKEYSDLMELDFYWNTTSNDVCKYAHCMWVGKVNDGFQITIYISHKVPIGVLLDEDGKPIMDGPGPVDTITGWGKFVHGIEQMQNYFDSNPKMLYAVCIIVIGCIILLTLGVIRLIKYVIKKTNSMNQDIREENQQNENDKKHNLRKSWILVLIICLIVIITCLSHYVLLPSVTINDKQQKIEKITIHYCEGGISGYGYEQQFNFKHNVCFLYKYDYSRKFRGIRLIPVILAHQMLRDLEENQCFDTFEDYKEPDPDLEISSPPGYWITVYFTNGEIIEYRDEDHAGWERWLKWEEILLKYFPTP